MESDIPFSPSVGSIDILQNNLDYLLDRLSSDENLSAAALVNPLCALEEIGLDIAPGVANEIERRSLYSTRTLAARGNLVEQLEKYGLSFVGSGSLDDAVVQRALKSLSVDTDMLPDRLLPRRTGFSPRGSGEGKKEAKASRAAETEKSAPPTRARPFIAAGYDSVIEDPLSVVADRHPAIPLLLELRAIDMRAPRFGSRSLYDRVRQGKVTLPVSRFKAKRKKAGDGNG